MTAELLGLAERCEKETAGSRELDALVEAAFKRCGDSDLMFKVKHPHKNEFVPNEDGSVDLYAADDDNVMHKVARRKAPAYTSSLDDAMSLVGDNWWNVETGCDRSFFAKVLPWAVDCRGGAAANAATPALALTAAALRALASRDDVRGE